MLQLTDHTTCILQPPEGDMILLWGANLCTIATVHLFACMESALLGNVSKELKLAPLGKAV